MEILVQDLVRGKMYITTAVHGGVRPQLGVSGGSTSGDDSITWPPNDQCHSRSHIIGSRMCFQCGMVSDNAFFFNLLYL